MARQYQVNPRVRFVNEIMRRLIQWNIAPAHSYLLSVRGRKPGILHSTPVTIVQHAGQRWLVAPYGEVNWVRNARAAGEVTLSRGGKSENLALQELPPQERAPILKQYLPLEPIVQPYFTARPGSPLEDFAAEAGRHPVFRLDLRHSPHPGCPPVDNGFPDGVVSNDDGVLGIEPDGIARMARLTIAKGEKNDHFGAKSKRRISFGWLLQDRQCGDLDSAGLCVGNDGALAAWRPTR